MFYKQGTSKGYVFPLTSYGPPLALIKVIALELAMSAAELSVFYNNRHPKAEVSSKEKVFEISITFGVERGRKSGFSPTNFRK